MSLKIWFFGGEISNNWPNHLLGKKQIYDCYNLLIVAVDNIAID